MTLFAGGRPVKSNNHKVYTPRPVVDFVFNVVGHCQPDVVLDPALGTGNLIVPFKAAGAYTMGCDVDNVGADFVDYFHWGPFEDSAGYPEQPDLIVCNPPWTSLKWVRNYAEIFLRKTVDLFGRGVPTVLFVPIGFRLNQTAASARWRWLADNTELTCIISCPLDLYAGVKIHNEILVFNLPCRKSHYWILI